MKLPDFTNNQDFKRLKIKMGAKSTPAWMSNTQYSSGEIAAIWAEMKVRGLDVNLNDITICEDSTFEYLGQKVLVYIRDQMVSLRHEAEYKFHVAWCDTLQKMKEGKRYYSRYVVSRRTDGKFIVNKIQNNTIIQENAEIQMRVCKNCLKTLDYEGFDTKRNSKRLIYEKFSLDAFFEKYDTRIKELPSHDAESAPQNVYPDNFSEFSKRLRQEAGWSCELCGKNMYKNQGDLHVHHIDGNRANNIKSNLSVLCKSCHNIQPLHKGDVKRRRPKRQDRGRKKNRSYYAGKTVKYKDMVVTINQINFDSKRVQLMDNNGTMIFADINTISDV